MLQHCLLPGRIRRLGGIVYESRQRLTKTTVKECRAKGGDYPLYDSASYPNVVKKLTALAEKGDVKSQIYLGELYIKGGFSTSDHFQPRYDRAAYWFQKAADQGNNEAQMLLFQLYRYGLGVPKDSQKVLELFKQATGLEARYAIYENSVIDEKDREIAILRKKIRELKDKKIELQEKIEDIKKDAEQTREKLEKEKTQLKKFKMRTVTKTRTIRLTQSEKRELKRNLEKYKTMFEKQSKESKKLQKGIERLKAERDTIRHSKPVHAPPKLEKSEENAHLRAEIKKLKKKKIILKK